MQSKWLLYYLLLPILAAFIINQVRDKTMTKPATTDPAKGDPFLVRDVLPADVRPVNYQLHLTPALAAPFRFAGHARVHVRVQSACQSVTVNAAELVITKVSVETGKGFAIDQKCTAGPSVADITACISQKRPRPGHQN